MASPSNLVLYAAVAKDAVILAEYSAFADADLSSAAAKCLEQLPPLHSRFSYTTSRRMFICLIDHPFIYCAIVDEALRKAEAFLFLEQVRDSFRRSLKERGTDTHTLGPHCLDQELAPCMRHLAAPLIGIPQKEKDRIEEELQATEVDFEVSSPSAVAPFHEMNDQDFTSKTEQKPLGSRSPRMAFLGKPKNKVKDQAKDAKEISMENKGQAMDKGKKLEIMVEGDTPAAPSSEMQKPGSMEKKDAQSKWWRHVKLVVMLDVVVCMILLAIWLVVCQGISCVK